MANALPFEKSKVFIENPVSAAGHITSRKMADRYVRRGLAKWTTNNRIKFIEADHRFVSARLAADDGRMARLDQVQGLPCAGPAIKVFMVSSKRGNGYGRA